MPVLVIHDLIVMVYINNQARDQTLFQTIHPVFVGMRSFDFFIYQSLDELILDSSQCDDGSYQNFWPRNFSSKNVYKFISG